MAIDRRKFLYTRGGTLTTFFNKKYENALKIKFLQFSIKIKLINDFYIFIANPFGL
jgi:hypothetical protein